MIVYAIELYEDPNRHQGRRRTRPFVRGDYDTHVYLECEISVSIASF